MILYAEVQPSIPMTPEPTFREEKHRFTQQFIAKGSAVCPCCGRKARRYKRKLNSQMARFLIMLSRAERGLMTADTITEGGKHWVDARSLMGTRAHKASSDGSYLLLWELVERLKPGFYRLTVKGERFAMGSIRVPRHVIVVDGARKSFSEDSTSIREALHDHFNFDQLMYGSGEGR